MNARSTLVLCCSALVVGCGFDLDRESLVKDRRILAIQAEPPELVGGALTPAFIQVRALVAQPGGAAPSDWMQWMTCARTPLGSSRRCDAQSASVELEETANLGVIDRTLPVPLEIGFALAAELPFAPQWQLQLSIGAQSPLVALKTVAVSPVLPIGQAANQNPVLTRLELDDVEWTPAAPLVLTYGACPEESMVPAQDGSSTRVCTHRLTPVFGDDQKQEFVGVNALGVTALQRERMHVSWFSDDGQFDLDTTEEPDPLLSLPGSSVTNTWREPPARVDSVTLWVVVRDGRGGQTFEQRQIQFRPE